MILRTLTIGKELWDKKSKYIQERDDLTAEETYEKAGIYAEFSKVVVFQWGLFFKRTVRSKLELRAYILRRKKALTRIYRSFR